MPKAPTFFLATAMLANAALAVLYLDGPVIYAAWCIPPAFACLLAGLYRLGD